MIQGILGRPVKTEIAQKPAKTEHVLMGFAIVSHLSQGSSVNLSSVKMTVILMGYVPKANVFVKRAGQVRYVN